MAKGKVRCGVIYCTLSNLIRKVSPRLDVRRGMGGQGDGRIVFKATSHFLGPLLAAKTPELADIDGFLLGNGGFDPLKKGFDDRPADFNIATGLLTNLAG